MSVEKPSDYYVRIWSMLCQREVPDKSDKKTCYACNLALWRMWYSWVSTISAKHTGWIQHSDSSALSCFTAQFADLWSLSESVNCFWATSYQHGLKECAWAMRWQEAVKGKTLLLQWAIYFWQDCLEAWPKEWMVCLHLSSAWLVWWRIQDQNICLKWITCGRKLYLNLSEEK